MCWICGQRDSGGFVSDVPVTESGSATYTANSSLPVFSIAQISNQLLNGYWENQGGSAFQWAPGNTTITYNVAGLSAGRATLARLAFATWQEVSGLTFQETGGSAEITVDDNASGAYAYSSTWNNNITTSTINVASNWESGDSSVDSYTFGTFIHEIGHTLGLGHGGNYNGNATYGVDNHYRNDTTQYSIMSYFGQDEYGGASYRYNFTPMMADIYAVQSVYGAGTARTGNTTYGFNVTGLDAATAQLYTFSNWSRAPALTIYDSGGTDTLDVSGYSQSQVINLAGGSFSNIGGLTGNIGIYTTSVIENAIGGSGNDTIYGNGVGNSIWGGRGGDTLLGLAGDDYLYGQLGDDLLVGGGDRDRLYGEAGNDRLFGEDGDDFVYGFGGADELYGQAGIDDMDGGEGIDLIRGGTGNDTIRGGFDNDTIWGEEGADTIWGQDGDDYISGGSENDILYGEAGNDRLYGDDGDDFGGGFAGDDVMYGGSGNDTLDGGEGTDTLYGDIGADYLLGGFGDDSLWGLADHDTLAGQDGNDLIVGGGGNDNLYGEAGNDRQFGEDGNDNVWGFDGADQLFGQNGNDNVNGGNGDDFVSGGAGNDTLIGGAGRDYFYFDSPLLAGNIDSIFDFTAGVDFLQLSVSIFSNAGNGQLSASAFRLGSTATAAGDRLIYNQTDGRLLYDADGSGGGAAIHFATLSNLGTLQASDIILV